LGRLSDSRPSSLNYSGAPSDAGDSRRWPQHGAARGCRS
jgi:hypothetical protein